MPIVLMSCVGALRTGRSRQLPQHAHTWTTWLTRPKPIETISIVPLPRAPEDILLYGRAVQT